MQAHQERHRVPQQRKHPRPPVGREARGHHSRAQRQRGATERSHIWRFEVRFHSPRALRARHPGAWEHSPQLHQAPSCRAPKQHRETRQRRRPRSAATGSSHPCTEATGPRAEAPWPSCCSRPLPRPTPRGPDRRDAVSTGPALPTLHPPGRRAAVSTGEALSTPHPRGPGRRSSVSTGEAMPTPYSRAPDRCTAVSAGSPPLDSSSIPTEEAVPTPHPRMADGCTAVSARTPPLNGSPNPGASRGVQSARGRAQRERRTSRQRERPRSVATGSPPPRAAATGALSGAPRSTKAAPSALRSRVFDRLEQTVPTGTSRLLQPSQDAQRTTTAHSRLRRRDPRSVRPQGGARPGT